MNSRFIALGAVFLTLSELAFASDAAIAPANPTVESVLIKQLQQRIAMLESRIEVIERRGSCQTIPRLAPEAAQSQRNDAGPPAQMPKETPASEVVPHSVRPGFDEDWRAFEFNGHTYYFIPATAARSTP
jgi:hypothetical protein